MFFRRGKGTEEIGNSVGIDFTCVLGKKHSGTSYCHYAGNYRSGLFHGFGEFRCYTGQYYKGEWKEGKRHGQGEMFYIRDGEMGDIDRHCIGGVDSMYRMKLFQGEFVEDIRQGRGILTYTNDDRLEGHFENGQPHGTMLYYFAATGKMNVAVYKNGYRISWKEVRRASISLKKTPGKKVSVLLVNTSR